ncbi:HAD domain-containing protein [Actinoplanes solisilvae]|uniref:HAD domain-containing protein n=1 Tax=Actinoplanes solisilvae TaxID=2486853 RepID=UPI003D78EA0F
MLFLDVDGPLLPFRARRDTEDPLLARIDRADGPRLRALNCRLVWATTWMDEANEVVAPLLGLPELPVVRWPDDDDVPIRGMHWKTAPLTRWARGQPFVWLDDEIGDMDRLWVAGEHPAPALLHKVDPYLGLTEDDLETVRRWVLRSDSPRLGR